MLRDTLLALLSKNTPQAPEKYLRLYNNLEARLSYDIGASDPALQFEPISSGWPAYLSSSEYFFITATNSAGLFEIMKVTRVEGDRLYVERGREMTTPQAWKADNTILSVRLTAGILSEMGRVDEVNRFRRAQSFEQGAVLHDEARVTGRLAFGDEEEPDAVLDRQGGALRLSGTLPVNIDSPALYLNGLEWPDAPAMLEGQTLVIEGQKVVGRPASFYLGAFVSAPNTSFSGGPLVPGMTYYNLTSMKTLTWNGLNWIGSQSLVPAAETNLAYRTVAGQLDYPLTVPDVFGNTQSLAASAPQERLSVFLNGLKLAQDDGTGFGQYTVDYATSTLTLLSDPGDGQRLQIDVLTPPERMARGSVSTFSVLDLDIDWTQPALPSGQIDGTRRVFDLWFIDPDTNTRVQLNAGNPAELEVYLDGVRQRPGVSYTVADGSIEFTRAPSADSVVWAVWNKPGVSASSPYVLPTAVGTFPNISGVAGESAYVINVAPYFIGDDLTFSVSGDSGTSMSGSIMTVLRSTARDAVLTITASSPHGPSASHTTSLSISSAPPVYVAPSVATPVSIALVSETQEEAVYDINWGTFSGDFTTPVKQLTLDGFDILSQMANNRVTVTKAETDQVLRATHTAPPIDQNHDPASSTDDITVFEAVDVVPTAFSLGGPYTVDPGQEVQLPTIIVAGIDAGVEITAEMFGFAEMRVLDDAGAEVSPRGASTSVQVMLGYQIEIWAMPPQDYDQEFTVDLDLGLEGSQVGSSAQFTTRDLTVLYAHGFTTIDAPGSTVRIDIDADGDIDTEITAQEQADSVGQAPYYEIEPTFAESGDNLLIELGYPVWSGDNVRYRVEVRDEVGNELAYWDTDEGWPPNPAVALAFDKSASTGTLTISWAASDSNGSTVRSLPFEAGGTAPEPGEWDTTDAVMVSFKSPNPAGPPTVTDGVVSNL